MNYPVPSGRAILFLAVGVSVSSALIELSTGSSLGLFMDVEKLIEEGYERPDDELEDYFGELYEEFGDDPRIVYEYANVLDYLGREREAIPLYREALKKGLSGKYRDMCLIQLASSLRLVGDLNESYEILSDLYGKTGEPSSLLFLSLTLIGLGRKDDALCMMLRHVLGGSEGFLEEYRRALTQYINEICKN